MAPTAPSRRTPRNRVEFDGIPGHPRDISHTLPLRGTALTHSLSAPAMLVVSLSFASFLCLSVSLSLSLSLSVCLSVSVFLFPAESPVPLSPSLPRRFRSIYSVAAMAPQLGSIDGLGRGPRRLRGAAAPALRWGRGGGVSCSGPMPGPPAFAARSTAMRRWR